jgi:hypothetical protein
LVVQVPSTLCGDEAGGHVFGGGEVATPAGLDGADGERDGKMRLPASGLTEEQNGPVLLDEPQSGEVLDEFAVDRGLELEVEVRDGLAKREPGVAEPGSETPVAGVDRFLVEQPGEELDVGPVVCLGVVGESGEHLGGPVQFQVAAVVLDLLVEPGGGHAPVSWSLIE